MKKKKRDPCRHPKYVSQMSNTQNNDKRGYMMGLIHSHI